MSYKNLKIHIQKCFDIGVKKYLIVFYQERDCYLETLFFLFIPDFYLSYNNYISLTFLL